VRPEVLLLWRREEGGTVTTQAARVSFTSVAGKTRSAEAECPGSARMHRAGAAAVGCRVDSPTAEKKTAVPLPLKASVVVDSANTRGAAEEAAPLLQGKGAEAEALASGEEAASTTRTAVLELASSPARVHWAAVKLLPETQVARARKAASTDGAEGLTTAQR
jgi:hypothetical protein